jgi:hypothetical protein
LIKDLEKYKDILDFQPEYPLTTEPLRIDIVVIKKTSDVVIENHIGAIFRHANVLEYKSPEDSLSIADFRKVMAYMYLYSSLEDVDVTDMSVTFVVTRHPRELIKSLKEVSGCTVTKRWPGIYIIEGYKAPIQIIESGALSDEDSLWIKYLRKGVGKEDINKIVEYSENTDALKAYLYVFLSANFKTAMEVINMQQREALNKFFIGTGIAAQWSAEALKKGREEVIDLLEQGYTLAEIKATLAERKAPSA